MRARSALLVFALGAATATHAQSIAPEFNGNYSFISLGSVPSVPTNYGGVAFKYDDPNTLLIGGSANGASGAIYSVGVVRNAQGYITGFSGPAQFYASAPNIDGGLAYGPGNVLFSTGYPTNRLMQHKPGNSSPDKTIDLTALGISSSVGAINFVPAGFFGAGSIKIASYNTGRF
ncbi:MAG TPA: hypothetical protein VEX38_05320 [Fimbriimonadaceae bacterium]|nr:hypothetical protein [Fimbriimonadaceae bacterium]